jgi:hypothetical protein
MNLGFQVLTCALVFLYVSTMALGVYAGSQKNSGKKFAQCVEVALCGYRNGLKLTLKIAFYAMDVTTRLPKYVLC